MFEQLVNLFFPIFGNFFAVFSRIKIHTETPNRLVLDVNTRLIVLDKILQIVSSSGQLLTKFDAIQSIDIDHFTNGSRGEWWVISLQLVDRKLRIGQTVDGVQSSIVAAHLSTITGKKVRSLPSWN